MKYLLASGSARAFGPIILFALAAAACATNDARPDSTQVAVPELVMERVPAASDSATVFAAELAFVRFLEASREGFKGRPVQWDTIVGCNPSNEPAFPVTLLARYSLLASGIRGDTVVSRAAVTSVAEQEPDDRRRQRYIAHQRVRTDTLEWDVVLDRAHERWLVCNGVRFGFVGPDSLTAWRSPESFKSARALAAMLYMDRR